MNGRETEFTWDAVAGVDGYNLYVKRDGESTFTKENGSLIATTSYTINDLPLGTHQAYVTSVKGGRESNPSTTITEEVTLATPTISYNDTRDELEWDIQVGVKGYDLYISTDGGSTFTKQNTALLEKLSYDVYNLAPGETVAYVVGVRDTEESDPSNELTFTVPTTPMVNSSGLAVHTLQSGRYAVRDVFLETAIGSTTLGSDDHRAAAFADNEDLILGNNAGIIRYMESTNYTSAAYTTDLGSRIDDMDIARDGSIIVVVQNGTGTIQSLDPTDLSVNWTWDSGEASNSGQCKLLDDQRVVYLDTSNNNVHLIAADGSSSSIIISSAPFYTLTTDASNNLYFNDRTNNETSKYNLSGTKLDSLAMIDPLGIEELDGYLYIGDNIGSGTGSLKKVRTSDMALIQDLSGDPQGNVLDVHTNGTVTNFCGDQRLRHFSGDPLSLDWEVWLGVNSNTRGGSVHPTRKY